MKRVLLVAAVLAVVGVASAVSADMVVERGLPTQNLNNAAGASRSNVAWADSEPGWFTGDDFKFGVAGQKYVVSRITTWLVDGLTTAGGDLGTYYKDVTLWGGTGPQLSKLATGVFSGNTTDNPNIVLTPVTYQDGSHYQGSSGSFRQIWQVDFLNLNWLVDGDVTYMFGVQATGRTDSDLWFNHASNAALSGSPQQGSDGKFLGFKPDGTFDYAWDSGATGGGWDKSSDINVLVYAQPIPEPVFFQMGALMGLSGLGLLRLRRKA